MERKCGPSPLHTMWNFLCQLWYRVWGKNTSSFGGGGGWGEGEGDKIPWRVTFDPVLPTLVPRLPMFFIQCYARKIWKAWLILWCNGHGLGHNLNCPYSGVGRILGNGGWSINKYLHVWEICWPCPLNHNHFSAHVHLVLGGVLWTLT